MKQKIHLSKTEIHNKEKDLSLDENSIDNFENALQTYLGEDSHIACLSSGTAAIHIALILAGVEHGDEVICQSFTFAASANPIKYQGATPVFIDSETTTWNLCPIALEAAIKDRLVKGKKTKAIIAVHLYGMPTKILEIAAIAKKYNIVLIEDAAEALGSTYQGQKCGTFGDFGILSFNGNKIITTSGGGALVCNNEKDKQRAIFLATQARDNAPHYQHSEIGYNYRMSNILAGIGRGQVEVLDKHVALRRSMHQFYQEVFKEVKGIAVFSNPSTEFASNHWLSCVVIEEEVTGFTREMLRLALLEDNIESRPLWKPMHLQPVFKACPYYGGTVAEELFEKGLCLPSGSNLADEDRSRILKSIQQLLGKYAS